MVETRRFACTGLTPSFGRLRSTSSRIRSDHGSGEQNMRTLRPLGLVAKTGIWYLIASGERGPRTYRVERLAELHLTDEQFEPLHDFDLVTYWQAHTEEVERLRSEVTPTLRVPMQLLPTPSTSLPRPAHRSESEDQTQCGVDSSKLVEAQVPDPFSEPARIDCARLLDEDAGREACNLNPRAEGRRSRRG